MTEIREILDSDLHAYVDDELDLETAAEVERWLVEHPDDAVRVHRYRLQRIQLHELYDDGLTAPIPAEVEVLLSDPGWMQWMPNMRRLAAGIVLLAVGGIAGWGSTSLPIFDEPVKPANFVRRALDAHVVYAHDTSRPVEVGVNQEILLMSWLSGRLGHPLRTPKLSGAGFNFIGGRLVADQAVPAAQFMYENSLGKRVTLYVRTGNKEPDTAFRFIAEKGMGAFYWTDGPLSYVLTGEMPRGDLLDLADMVHKDLDTVGISG